MSAPARIPKRKLAPAPLQTAKVIELAEHKQVDATSDSAVEKKILDRIRKCLARANHPNTGESEAKAAWRMSTRLMQQYNVTQADLLEKATNEDDYSAIWGRSVVVIKRAKDDGRRVTFQTWVSDIGAAMQIFFDCKYYTTALGTSIEWTFYGIAANTVPAAMAFEMAHNLALEWARSKGMDKNSYCLGIGRGLFRQAQKEKAREKRRAEEMESSQRKQAEFNGSQDSEPGDTRDDEDSAKSPDGLPTRLKAGASPCPEEETKFQVKLEDYENEDQGVLPVKWEAEEKKDLHTKSESDEERENDSQFSMDDSDDYELLDAQDPGYVSEEEIETEPTFKEEEEKPVDLDADFEEQLREAMPAPASNFPADDDDESNRHDTIEAQLPVNPWNTTQALVRFRQSAEKVASEYLKAQNVKMKAGRKRKRTIRNSAVYREGMEDSRKIDVRRRRIEES